MISRSSLILCISLSIISDVFPAPQTSEKKKFALEDLIPLRSDLRHGIVSGKWLTEDSYVFLDPATRSTKRFNAATKSISDFIGPNTIDIPKGSYITSFSPDAGKFLMLVKNDAKVFRRSSIAEYAVIDLATKQIFPVAEGERLQSCMWSPAGGGSVAYVKDNNVYYIPDITNSNSTNQLTDDGILGEIYNGIADWIYEEEVLNSADAMWFSTGGSNLAVASFNDTNVEMATYPIYGSPNDIDFQYPIYNPLRYPKAGRTNPKVSLHVHLNIDGESSIFRIPPPAIEKIQSDPILGAVNWLTDNDIAVLWLNRRQNMSALMMCHVEVSKASCFIHNVSEEPTGWIDITAIMFSKDASKFITIKPSACGTDRYPHIIKEDINTRAITDLTPVETTVHQILGWHESTDTVFYLASPADKPWERQVWASTPLGNRCVSCSVESGCPTADAKFAPGAAFATIACSGHNKPPVTLMYDLQANTLSHWSNNSALENTLSHYDLAEANNMIIEIAKDVKAHVRLLLPPNMEADKKYPLILNVYAGPGSIRVMDEYKLDYHTYLTTNRSFIVCFADVRGSGALGMKAMHAINNALGTYEITDTIDVLKVLLKTFDYIDPTRVGVWGWSYGGYTSAMMLANSDHNLIKCAVSVAPVTSWLYYDSIYTERYMDTPENNNISYMRSDLVLQAPKLKGKQFLLIHGTADDNVHYQNSMMLSKELQHKDIDFEEMSYADEAHALSSVLPHLYHTIDHFWTRCFA